MTLTPDQREALRQKVMAEMNRRMPIISKRFNDWRDWPGTWAFADVAVAALQDELARGVPEFSEGCIKPSKPWPRASGVRVCPRLDVACVELTPSQRCADCVELSRGVEERLAALGAAFDEKLAKYDEPQTFDPELEAAADAALERLAGNADSALLDHIQRTGSTVELLPGDRFRIGGLHAAVSTDLRAAIRIAAGASGVGEVDRG